MAAKSKGILTRAPRLEGAILRLRPIVHAEGKNGIKIVKTGSEWMFLAEGLDELEARLQAIYDRLKSCRVVVRCEGGQRIVTLTL